MANVRGTPTLKQSSFAMPMAWADTAGANAFGTVVARGENPFFKPKSNRQKRAMPIIEVKKTTVMQDRIASTRPSTARLPGGKETTAVPRWAKGPLLVGVGSKNAQDSATTQPVRSVSAMSARGHNGRQAPHKPQGVRKPPRH